MTAEERQAEIEDLKAKLAVREGKPGLSVNVQAIRARIEELENAN